MHKNVELKARCPNPDEVRSALLELDPEEAGTDHQVDTYFRTNQGRLKLREGNIENNLIYYERPDQSGPKEADIHLYETESGSDLKPMLEAALGVLVVVEKRREIYFLENVKFHIDRVDGLGSFVEIEAIDQTGNFSTDELRNQCQTYMEQLGIDRDQLVSCSYSDLLLEKRDSRS